MVLFLAVPCFLAVLCGTASGVAGQTPPDGDEAVLARGASSPSGVEGRDLDLAWDVLEVARLPSLSWAILGAGADGEPAVVRRVAIGWADVEAQEPATPDTRYRAASVSKLITATALGRLVADGRLGWDAELSGLLPDFPGADGITARRLAGHLAGIAHYQPADRIERFREYRSVTEALTTFRDSPRAGAPGAQYAYTTHGFTLLSAMMEAAAGGSFLELVRDQVTTPLGMTRTGPALLPGADASMAQLYAQGPRGRVRVPFPENPSYKWAGGGLATTPTDLVRMARAYLAPAAEDPFLPPEVLEVMWTSQQVAGEDTGVGIAWRVGEDSSGRRIAHHSGSMGGARSTLVLYPEQPGAVAVMTNSVWSSDIERTAALLLDAWRLPPFPTPSGRFDASVELVASERVGVDRERGASGAAEAGDGAADGDGAMEDADPVGPVQQTVTLTAGRGSLPVPEDIRAVVRARSDELRIAPVGVLDGAEVWALASPRGLARGTCAAGEVAGLVCRFALSRARDVVVRLVPVAEAVGMEEPGPEKGDD